MVRGARQIGKTFIIEDFGKKHYASYIYLNFYQNPEHKKIFDGSLEAVEIYKKISLYVRNVSFIEGDTLIFLDEIQEGQKPDDARPRKKAPTQRHSFRTSSS